MSDWQRPSTVSLFAAHLRGELVRGRWSGRMPGVMRLAAEMGVARNTVEAALKELECEGLLVPQGHGRGRIIDLRGAGGQPHGLRVAIQLHEPLAFVEGYIIELQNLLQKAGFTAFFTEKGLMEMRMNVERVEKLVHQTDADAWVVIGGSRDVLNWFVSRQIPAFALFGRRRGLPIAGVGPDKVRTYRDIVRRLAALGHRRMVLLALKSRRLPEPGASELAFLDEMAAQGIPTSPFNLPDWEVGPEGLIQVLDSLFHVTPPTALLIDEAYLFHAVKHHLSRQGIRVPEDVSLICTDPDHTFLWCRPSIAHIAWDNLQVVRRVVRWANNVSRGKIDIRQSLTPARLVGGGTIGTVKDGLGVGDWPGAGG